MRVRWWRSLDQSQHPRQRHTRRKPEPQTVPRIPSVTPNLRKTCLKPEYASLYPEVPPNIWLGAAGVAARVAARLRGSADSNYSLPKRVLPDEHFRIPGWAPPQAKLEGTRLTARREVSLTSAMNPGDSHLLSCSRRDTPSSAYLTVPVPLPKSVAPSHDKGTPGQSRGRKATGPRCPPRRRTVFRLTPRRTPRSPSCRKGRSGCAHAQRVVPALVGHPMSRLGSTTR
jgi:hypothetical protein